MKNQTNQKWISEFLKFNIRNLGINVLQNNQATLVLYEHSYVNVIVFN